MSAKTLEAPATEGAAPARTSRRAGGPSTAPSAPPAHSISSAGGPVQPEAVPAHEARDDREGAEIESGKRRMPDNLRRFLLRVQGGKFYLPAAYRIVWFRDECPDWGVETQLLEGGQ